MSIGGIRLAELGTHPLFLHAELDPEREEAAKLITMITGTATKGRNLSSATVKKAGP